MEEMTMKKTLSIAALLALCAAAALPTIALAQSATRLIITSEPPAPRYEVIPAPRSGYVWAPGYWNWEGNRHVWVPGQWEAARSGYEYRQSNWVRVENGWRLERGSWQRAERPRDGRAEDDDGYIRVAPPEPRIERNPRPRPGYVWAPGYWAWKGDRHEWVRGKFVRARPGYVYVSPEWVEAGGLWVLEAGRWARDRNRDGIADREQRDRDRDGIEDNNDADLDNDGIRNGRDSDMDGDGVPNERDRYPDNPRRS